MAPKSGRPSISPHRRPNCAPWRRHYLIQALHMQCNVTAHCEGDLPGSSPVGSEVFITFKPWRVAASSILPCNQGLISSRLVHERRTQIEREARLEPSPDGSRAPT